MLYWLQYFLHLPYQIFLPVIQSQDDNEDVDEEDLAPTGQVVNSKNLVLSGVTFNEDENKANIAGMIFE